MKKVTENFLNKFTEWLFRVKAVETFLLKTATLIIIAVYGAPFIVELIYKFFNESSPKAFEAVRQIIDFVDFWILMLCTLMVIVAMGIIVFKFIDSTKSKRRERIVVVEARGLRDDDGVSLEAAVAKTVGGNITPILIDLRNNLDGKVIEPEIAINKIISAHTVTKQYSKGDRRDLSLVYGGLTSVPYTFLTGILFDDENNIITYDWDRQHEKWRLIDGEDDGENFQVKGLDELGQTDDVVLAVAYSYTIKDSDLTGKFSYPVVRLSMNSKSSNAHWSREKQNRLAQDFFEVVKQITAAGAKRIHLVMAAPNSVVFTFARRYDKRNLPQIFVYQFERSESPAYPWGIMMPVSGVGFPQVI